MLRSLYSGISGLRSHQTMLDVTGNNIANVNTTGFKVSATQFQDTLSQMVQGAGGAQPDAGGTNPAQVGLGVRVAGISTNFSQGAAQSTGKASDMMISGDGFFVTRIGTETLFTRAGAFDFDSEGRLVSPDGSLVQGWTAVNGVIPDRRRRGRHHAPAAGHRPREAHHQFGAGRKPAGGCHPRRPAHRPGRIGLRRARRSTHPYPDLHTHGWLVGTSRAMTEAGRPAARA